MSVTMKTLNEGFNKRYFLNESKNQKSRKIREDTHTGEWRLRTQTDRILDKVFAHLRDVMQEDEFIEFTRSVLGMDNNDLLYYCDIDVNDLDEQIVRKALRPLPGLYESSNQKSRKLTEKVFAEKIYTIGIYGDEVPGFDSVYQFIHSLKEKGINILDYDGGDTDYGWELTISGPARVLYNTINNKVPGYHSASMDDFITEYSLIDEDEFDESLKNKSRRVREDVHSKIIPYVAFDEDEEVIVKSEIVLTKNKDGDGNSYWEVSFGPYDDYEEFDSMTDAIDYVKNHYANQLFIKNPKDMNKAIELLKSKVKKEYPDIANIEVEEQHV